MTILRYLKMSLILVGTITIISCEKVIEVNLREAEPRLVIEGNITTDASRNKVTLTTSGGYFDNSAVQPVKNAVVRVIDENGNSEVLQEVSPGEYYMNSITGSENTKYSIEVEVDGTIFTGEEYLPVAVPIDSLYYEIDDFSPPGNDEEGDRYNLKLTLSDPPDTMNFYRIVTYINGELVAGGGFSYYRVLEDELIDGLTFTLTIRGTEARVTDTVYVELQSIGSNTYLYFEGLNDAVYGGGGPGSTPYNPTTNLSGDALGYFGAYSYTSASVIIDD